MENKPSGMIIKNVRIFDGTNEKLQEGMQVYIKDNRIEQISPKAIFTPDSVAILDGKGHVLMPGLINSHFHMLGALPSDVFYSGPPLDYRVFSKISRPIIMLRISDVPAPIS